jgi:hypothetical protein
VILFVLFGGSVGGLIFLHYQYGSEAIKEILEQVPAPIAQYCRNTYGTGICTEVPIPYLYKQGCGSGSGLDPDSETCVDPDPDPYWESGSGSRGKKTQKFQWKNSLFSYF